MSISIYLEKINYNQFINKLMENKKINNKELLEKIILEFGNKIGDELIIIHNEYWEDGICTCNMFRMIEEVFNLEDDDYVNGIFYDLRKGLINYKEIHEAYENLGLERSEINE